MQGHIRIIDNRFRISISDHFCSYRQGYFNWFDYVTLVLLHTIAVIIFYDKYDIIILELCKAASRHWTTRTSVPIYHAV